MVKDDSLFLLVWGEGEKKDFFIVVWSVSIHLQKIKFLTIIMISIFKIMVWPHDIYYILSVICLPLLPRFWNTKIYYYTFFY